jgi:prepilin-type N-terminal cleavage/methylation domain-containing protein
MTHRRAFTLVELLTVITILLIVMAIAFPVFFQAKGRAKEVVCESNLHQEFLAISLYENDFDALPGLSSTNAYWVEHYFGGTILKCPKGRLAGNVNDYSIIAGPFLGDTPWDKELNRVLADCKQKRGSEYPYVTDINHATMAEGYQSNGQWIFVVRESGALSRVPWRGAPSPIPGAVINNGPWPCDPKLPFDFQY